MDKPVNCGCGGEAKVEWTNGYDPFAEKRKPNLWYGVICKKCKIQTKSYYTEAEAVTAWNKAMGKQTAVVKSFGHPCGVYGYCSNCGGYCVNEELYCPHCGAKVEWE